jgi:homocysteine S-methyltransferase
MNFPAAQIVREFTGALPRGQKAPWLVLYPNSGDEYNVETQTWSSVGEGYGSGDWARELSETVAGIGGNELGWGGIVLGGCCRIGPREIGDLRSLVDGL